MRAELDLAASIPELDPVQTRVGYRVGGRPESIAIGDLNGDGKPDIVTANRRVAVPPKGDAQPHPGPSPTMEDIKAFSTRLSNIAKSVSCVPNVSRRLVLQRPGLPLNKWS